MIPQSILVISSDTAVTDMLRNTLTGAGHTVAVFSRLRSAFDDIYNDVPSLLIVDTHGDQEASDLLSTLKEDPLFVHLPVLVILADEDAAPDWSSLPAEDYIRRGDLEKDMLIKVGLCRARAERIVEVNPLTRLPGNISINRQIQGRLDQGTAFALAYADLDHFKPFNDKYGFSRGDEVIKMTGRLLLNIVRNRSNRNVFVGHVGGDDFICLMTPDLIEETCRELIEAFDRIVPSLYDASDRKTGWIESQDREGRARRFPIMTVSIGIACVEPGVFSHYGEVTGVASEMKSLAKKEGASCYRINRRAYS